MKLIIGLGNIGAHYDGTRHNAGFAVLDELARAQAVEWQPNEKFKAVVAETHIGSEKIILAKPSTYYNLSGEAAQAIKSFYKLENTDILAVHDELALPLGTVRVRQGGSDAGNNGIKSLIAHIGSDFARVRIGIANEQLVQYDAADFVLAPFSHEEREQLPAITRHVHTLVESFVAGTLAPTTLT